MGKGNLTVSVRLRDSAIAAGGSICARDRCHHFSLLFAIMRNKIQQGILFVSVFSLWGETL